MNDLLKKLQSGATPVAAPKPPVTPTVPLVPAQAKPLVPVKPGVPVVPKAQVVVPAKVTTSVTAVERTEQPAPAEAKPPAVNPVQRSVPTTLMPNEIPAGAEPPDDPAAKAFIETITSITEYYDNPSALSGVLRTIMLELHAKPQYMQMVSDENIHNMVRAMRETLGMTQAVKAVNKSKGGGAKRKATGTIANSSDLIAAAADFDFGV